MSYSQEQPNAMGSETPQASAPLPTPPPPPMPSANWGGRWPVAPNSKSPFLAGLLSAIMPGLGQVYLGYYQRGFVHAGVFAGIIACLASGAARHIEPLFGLMLAFFYFYNIVDAVRRTSLFNMALAGMTQAPVPEDFKMPGGQSSLVFGVVVTGIGFLLFLNTRFDFDLYWVQDWWPLAIVFLGVWIVYKAVRGRKA